MTRPGLGALLALGSKIFEGSKNQLAIILPVPMSSRCSRMRQNSARIRSFSIMLAAVTERASRKSVHADLRRREAGRIRVHHRKHASGEAQRECRSPSHPVEAVLRVFRNPSAGAGSRPADQFSYPSANLVASIAMRGGTLRN